VRTGENIVFSLRDRYNNITTASLTGTIQHNSDTPELISFARGTYALPLVGGYYTLDVPGLHGLGISYTDASGSHRIPGIDRYTAYIT
jgi:hypothetical protein